jgi:hypothetical protein
MVIINIEYNDQTKWIEEKKEQNLTDFTTKIIYSLNVQEFE